MFCVAMFGILWAKRYSEGEGMKRQNDPLLPGCWAASEAGGYPELKPSATRGERLGWLAAMCGRLIKCYEIINNNAAAAGYRLAVRALSRKADENDQAISDDCYAMLGRMRRLAADVYALACEMLPDGGDFGAAGAIRESDFADVRRAWLTIQHAARVKAALPDAPAGATPPTPQADAPPAPLGDEITAAQLCQRWDIPKSQVTKYTQKAPGDVNYLPSRKIGQNVYVKLADAEKWAENYEARRDARAKGKISNQDIRNALKRF
jgi:hypothetical protein